MGVLETLQIECDHRPFRNVPLFVQANTQRLFQKPETVLKPLQVTISIAVLPLDTILLLAITSEPLCQKCDFSSLGMVEFEDIGL